MPQAASKIAWQNKDIVSKIFAEQLKGKSLKTYGINVPEVREVLPTNLPAIQANELRMDNLFLLADGSLAIVDYESVYKTVSMLKYISYICRVVKHYQKKWNQNITVRMIVIYTADVKRQNISSVFSVGCLELRVQSAFLLELDSDGIWKHLCQKIRSGKKLTDEDKMKFIILPMSYKGRKRKNEAIRDGIHIAEEITNIEDQAFLLAGMAVFTDKIIEKKYAEKIERMVSMTKVGQIIADREAAAVNEAVKKKEAEFKAMLKKRERKQKRKTQAEHKAIVERFIATSQMSDIEIAYITNFCTPAEVRDIRNEMLTKA